MANHLSTQSKIKVKQKYFRKKTMNKNAFLSYSKEFKKQPL